MDTKHSSFFRNLQTQMGPRWGYPFPIARGRGGGGTLGTSEAQWAKAKMAEVGMNPLPSGYEYEFISTVLDDHHCLICHLPLREPVQTRCGHRFCKICLDEAIRRYENRPCMDAYIFVGVARWLGSPD